MISPFLFPGFDGLLDLFFSHGEPGSARFGEFLPHFVEKVRLILAFRVMMPFKMEQSQSTSLPHLFKMLLGCFDLQFSGFRIAKDVQFFHNFLINPFGFGYFTTTPVPSNFPFLSVSSKNTPAGYNTHPETC